MTATSPTGPGYFPWQQPSTFQPTPVTTHFISHDYLLTKVRAIVEMLNAKAITQAEARKILARVDPLFAAVLA